MGGGPKVAAYSLFINARDELTEGTFIDIVPRFGDRVLTPEVGSGLLPDVLREELLERVAHRGGCPHSRR